MKYTGMEWIVIDTPIQLKEVSAPATPLADKLKLYAKDLAGVSALYYKDDAGVEHDLSGGLTGSGAAGKVAIWSAATILTYDTLFSYVAANDFLGVGIATPLSRIHSVQTGTVGGVNHVIQMDSYGVRNILAMTKANGTEASPTSTVIGEQFFELLGAQYASGVKNSASMDFVSGLLGGGGTISGTSTPSHWRVQLTTDGTVSRSTRFAVTPNTGGGLLVLGGGTQVLTANTGIELAPLAGQAPSTIIRGNAYGTSTFMNYQATHARGTAGSPTATQANDVIGRFSALMYGASQYSAAQVASMNFLSGEAATNTANGTYITFNTTPLLSVTIAERFRIGPSGQWGIGGATYGSSGDIFSSGGSAAAPTWVTRATLNAALDHGTLAGLTDDDHTQYALLAGRNGGQVLIGGTASGDDLTLQSTSNGTRGSILITSDDVLLSGTRTMGTTEKALIDITITVTNTVSTVAGMWVRPTFSDAGNYPIGVIAQPTFAPSANIDLAVGFQCDARMSPPSGKTVAAVQAGTSRIIYSDVAGAVTTGVTHDISAPVVQGALKPGTQIGLNIANQSAAGMTTGVGLNIQDQTGATNNAIFGFGTVDTTAAGAYYGRLPVFYNGLVKYIHVFSA